MKKIFDSWDERYKKPFGAIKKGEPCEFRIRLPKETVLDFPPVPILVVFRTGYKETFLTMNLEKEEDTMYFVCPQGHIRLDFETATEYDFICPECGEELEFFDNTNLIKQIKDDIKTVESNYKSFTKKVDA